jgi:hypothetical protein
MVQFSVRAQGPGIAEQKQIAHQLLEHQRLAGIQAADVQVALVLQFVKASSSSTAQTSPVSRCRMRR